MHPQQMQQQQLLVSFLGAMAAAAASCQPNVGAVDSNRAATPLLPPPVAAMLAAATAGAPSSLPQQQQPLPAAPTPANHVAAAARAHESGLTNLLAQHAMNGLPSRNSTSARQPPLLHHLNSLVTKPHALFSGCKLRRGKWLPEEEEYASVIIDLFERGALYSSFMEEQEDDEARRKGTTDAPTSSPTASSPPSPPAASSAPQQQQQQHDCINGATLRLYLSQKLHCQGMRISKKHAGKSIGKMIYLAKPLPADVTTIRNLHAQLKKRQQAFLQAVFPGIDISSILVQQVQNVQSGQASLPFVPGVSAVVVPRLAQHIVSHPASFVVGASNASLIPTVRRCRATRAGSRLFHESAAASIYDRPLVGSAQ
jgi:hypothetical protein